MSSKAVRGNRLESEIEKSREEGNWKRVIELAEQLKSSRNVSETLSNFLIGEGKLELYVEQNPPIDANSASAKSGLSDARKYLEMCTGDSTKKVEVSLDALLLLAKVEYACGNHHAALKRLSDAGLHQLTEKALPTRSLRIVAESYAIEGLSLEKVSLPHNSKYQQVEREEKLIKCFELAGDLALLYLQEQDRLASPPSSVSLPSLAASVNTASSTSPLPPNGGSDNKKIGIILETALQRCPIIHMKSGHIEKAVARYRSMLMAVESSATQNLRLTLARQLAEVLLRGVCELSYIQPPKAFTGEKSRSTSSLKTLESPWKPRKYSGSNLFFPQNVNEEIILLLLISEAMAVREAVLSQSPEFNTARSHAYHNATAVHDLLCISLARRKQFPILLEVFERAMKFSFEASHVWQQFALALACSRQNQKAIQVLRETYRLLPSLPHNCLLAAKINFQHLGKVEEGMVWVDRALTSLEEGGSLGIGNICGNSGILSSRCYLFRAIGYTMMAVHCHRHSEVQSLKSNAIEALTKAQQLDSADHLIEYYFALHFAESRQLVEATQHVKMALYLRPEHPPSLLLLILLLSAQKEHDEALQLAEATVQEYPEHLQLLYVKASLEEEMHGSEAALVTARHMLILWNNLYKDQSVGEAAELQSQLYDSASVYNNLSEKDTVSIHAESIAASRVEAALSEVASTLSSCHPKPGPQQAWLLQIQIWLLTAHLYIKSEDYNEAKQCLQEASSIFPMSHHIMFMNGLFQEKKLEFDEALASCQNALSINPYHSRSLRHLATVHHYLGKHRLAEKTLLDAIKVDPKDHIAWAALGDVTNSLGHLEVASKCYATALELESSSPVLPFASLPLCYD